jgi:predicted nucleotidyltransferase
MSPLVEEKIDELKKLCEEYSVKCMEIFGSAASDADFDENRSDLDFLVEFQSLEENQYADAYFGLLFALQDLFDRPVDLVMTEAIRNPYFKTSVDRTRKVLYAA